VARNPGAASAVETKGAIARSRRRERSQAPNVSLQGVRVVRVGVDLILINIAAGGVRTPEF